MTDDQPEVDAATSSADAELASLRAELDTIDRALLDGVRDRLAVCARVAEIKQRRGIDVVQPGRMAVVHRRARDYAHRHGLSTEFVHALYTLLIDEACRVEEHLVAGADPAGRPR